jgi:hypothetical protein
MENPRNKKAKVRVQKSRLCFFAKFAVKKPLTAKDAKKGPQIREEERHP